MEWRWISFVTTKQEVFVGNNLYLANYFSNLIANPSKDPPHFVLSFDRNTLTNVKTFEIEYKKRLFATVLSHFRSFILKYTSDFSVRN